MSASGNISHELGEIITFLNLWILLMKYRLFAIFMTLAMLPCIVHAEGIYSYITESKMRDENTVEYYYTIAAWDEDSTMPNPCYGASYCALQINHRHKADGTGGQPEKTWAMPPISTTLRTVGELGREFKKLQPLPYTSLALHVGEKLTNECVGIFYWINNDFSKFRLLPGSVCGIAPPPGGICGFTSNTDITIDHGPVNAAGVHEPASVNIGMSCSSPSDLRLYIQTAKGGRLDLQGPGPGVYSMLKLNGEPADRGLGLPAVGPAGVNVSVSSQLFTDESSIEGDYSGSAVIILAVP